MNEELTQKQSKIESLLETLVNIFVGFWISFFYWKYFVLPMINKGTIEIDDTMYIIGAFTVLAIVRQYFWRRFFSNNLHIVLVNGVKKYYEK